MMGKTENPSFAWRQKPISSIFRDTRIPQKSKKIPNHFEENGNIKVLEIQNVDVVEKTGTEIVKIRLVFLENLENEINILQNT